VLNGDGSGVSTDGRKSTTNNGDSSGTYTGQRVSIVNDGSGEALVTSSGGGSTTVKAPAVPRAGRVGSFPAIGAIKAVKSCGTTITLRDGVLFDINEFALTSLSDNPAGRQLNRRVEIFVPTF